MGHAWRDGRRREDRLARHRPVVTAATQHAGRKDDDDRDGDAEQQEAEPHEWIGLAHHQPAPRCAIAAPSSPKREQDLLRIGGRHENRLHRACGGA
jgi:hypothetical protein